MKTRRKVLLTLLAIVTITIIGLSIFVQKMEAELQLFAQEVISDVDLSTANDGIFSATHKVLPIDVEVQVTVKNHRITDIFLVKHFNGQGSAAEVLPSQILKEQSLQVDAIAGATYSSKVIVKAIQTALLNAGATLK
jgi:uncharacterized protein with FMN-binding domain